MSTRLKPDFDTVFVRLKAIMQVYESEKLKGRTDNSGDYSLIGPPSLSNPKREFWTGGVRKGKAYVSYHLMAVYANPALLEGLSSDLKKHMQGKSCFNFKTVDEKLFKELTALTRKSYASLRKGKFIQ